MKETDQTEASTHRASDILQTQRQRGDLLFALVLCLVTLFLISQIGEQTRWFNRVNLTLQPRFWPVVILALLAVFSGWYFVDALRARRKPDALDTDLFPFDELMLWARPVEFGAYFLVYAALIPWLGCLFTTLLFMPLLGWRVGYREVRRLLLLAGIGLIIVILFKSALQVKMPAGAIYEYFPGALRNVFIRYL